MYILWEKESDIMYESKMWNRSCCIAFRMFSLNETMNYVTCAVIIFIFLYEKLVQEYAMLSVFYHILYHLLLCICFCTHLSLKNWLCFIYNGWLRSSKFRIIPHVEPVCTVMHTVWTKQKDSSYPKNVQHFTKAWSLY